MKLLKLLGAILALSLAGAATLGAADSTLTFRVIPTVAPNFFGTQPSVWDSWVNNTVTALQNGQTQLGTGSSAYQALADGVTIPLSSAVVTNFPSWLGVADPNTPLYSNEYGNRLHFSLTVSDNGNTAYRFSISQLSFVATSSDPGNVLGFSFGAGSYTYSASVVGVVDNPDGSVTYITSGPNTQVVDGVYLRGSGNGLEALTTDGQSTFQADIDAVPQKYGITGPTVMSAIYSIGDQSGSASVTLTVPEPSTLGAVIIGSLGLVALRRRR